MIKKLQTNTLFLATFILLTLSLQAQKELVTAKRNFELKAFDLAIENAKKAIDKKPDCMECYFVIAESFRMTNANVDAAIWYRKMQTFKELPEDYALNYGLLLKRMGQYDKAKEYFQEYASYNPELGNYYAESCDYAIELLSKDIDFELNLYSASSKKTDYAPSFYKNNLVFASFREDFKRDLEKQNKSIINPRGSQLFIGGTGFTGTINTVNFLLKEEDETYDIAPIHYASEAPVCAITRNNFRNGEKQVFTNDLELTLYLAQVNKDGSFKNKYAFPYNEAGYATGFGTLNETGTILYFSSNRPGGYGGFDLYVSYYRNNQWTYPENLGHKINTAGNEITPFFDGKELYFSSDYHKGLGGFDVFNAYVSQGVWTKPENMGNGINSPEDDFYFIKHPTQNSYYLSSNRLGGRGAHDIYLVHKETPLEAIENELVQVDYEDVTPAPINLETDLKDKQSSEIKAVSLSEDIEEEIDEDMFDIFNTSIPQDTENETLPEKMEESINFDELLPPKAVELNTSNSKMIALDGFKRVAYAEILDNTGGNVYFIQLAALFTTTGDMENFNGLNRYGSLYKVKQSNATKVKLGYFKNEFEAKEVLRKVKALGYSDAFLTFETLNTGRMELIEVSESTQISVRNTGYVSDEMTGTNFKVRLASYSDPIWFDVTKVDDIGVIEQWSKDEWTIFVLSGYKTKAEAEMAKLNAVNRGFSDAEVVIDNNGILRKAQ